MSAATETTCADCGKVLSDEDLRSTDPTRCASCEQAYRYDIASEPEPFYGANVERCADCAHPVYWSEPLGDWTHVNPFRACWLHDSRRA